MVTKIRKKNRGKNIFIYTKFAILDFLHFLANFGTDRKSRLQLHPVCFHDFFKLFENHVFWSKSRFLGLKVLIFRQNSIFGQKYDFWHSVMYEIMRILHVVSFLVANSWELAGFFKRLNLEHPGDPPRQKLKFWESWKKISTAFPLYFWFFQIFFARWLNSRKHH